MIITIISNTIMILLFRSPSQNWSNQIFVFQDLGLHGIAKPV